MFKEGRTSDDTVIFFAANEQDPYDEGDWTNETLTKKVFRGAEPWHDP